MEKFNVKIYPSGLQGKISAIGSKSDIHRLLILSALSDGKTEIFSSTLCDDTLATANALNALGARCEFCDRKFVVYPIDKADVGKIIDCNESGSTLRFLLPVATAISENNSFIGKGRLPERPIGELVECLKSSGVEFSSQTLPLSTKGKLKAGKYYITGKVSSQYISGLLMALAVCEGESEIILTSHLESKSYVDMTVKSLKLFGTEIFESETGYKIFGRKKLTSPKKVFADGDWSNSAFWLSSGAISEKIAVTGLDMASPQGDKKIISDLEAFGAKVFVEKTVERVENSTITVKKDKLSGTEIELSDTPDLLPILAVVASFCDNTTVFKGAKRLKLKESDRLLAVEKMINSLGGEAKAYDDGVIVYPKKLTGGTVNGFNDHRIVMAAAIGASCCEKETVITDAQAVRKSYPEFFEDFKALGGRFDVICDGK